MYFKREVILKKRLIIRVVIFFNDDLLKRLGKRDEKSPLPRSRDGNESSESTTVMGKSMMGRRV